MAAAIEYFGSPMENFSNLQSITCSRKFLSSRVSKAWLLLLLAVNITSLRVRFGSSACGNFAIIEYKELAKSFQLSFSKLL